MKIYIKHYTDKITSVDAEAATEMTSTQFMLEHIRSMRLL